MAYYSTCPNCGSNLDPGEHCDCSKETAGKQEEAQGQKDGKKTERRIRTNYNGL